MKNKFAAILGVAALLLSSQRGFSADAMTELKDLVAKVRVDLAAGKTTEIALADDLKQFDALLDEHKGEKTDDMARVLYMKAQFYREVIHNDAKADELVVSDNGVRIVGYSNVTRLGSTASSLYARNLYAFVETLIDKTAKALAVNWDDELVKATLLTRDGDIVHPNFAPKT